jgi:hypothetical protein
VHHLRALKKILAIAVHSPLVGESICATSKC